MKLKYILSAFVAGAAMLFTSCEDGLDIPKHGNMGTQNDFYKTDQEALEAVATLYKSWGDNYYNMFSLKNLLSDDVWTGGGSRGDNPDMERLNEYSFDTDHGTIAGAYQGLYAIIYSANLIIEKVEPDTPVKAQAVADAYFFRALAHFDLVTLWGTAPVVDHLLEPGEYRKGNSTPAELWEQVENDLRAAIDSKALPTKNGAADPMGAIRVTHETALAMLGKAYLFQGKYAEAPASSTRSSTRRNTNSSRATTTCCSTPPTTTAARPCLRSSAATTRNRPGISSRMSTSCRAGALA